MDKKYYLIGIGGVLIVALGWFAFSQGLFSPSEVSAPESQSDSDDVTNQVPVDEGIEETIVSDGEDTGEALEDNGDAVESDGEATDVTVVTYSDAGFTPSTLEVEMGKTVNFVNGSSGVFWPASAIHPTHTLYPGSSIGKCGTGEADTIFDACSSVAPGESYSFTFDEVGTWKYHNHLRPLNNGKIIVN